MKGERDGERRILEICLKGKGKDEGFGMKVKNEQLREIGRERDGEKRQRGLGSPKDCANPSNPDTS